MNHCKATFFASSLCALLLTTASFAQGPANPPANIGLAEIRAVVKKLDPNAREIQVMRDGKAVTTFTFKLKIGDDTLPATFNVHEDRDLWMSFTLSGPIADLSKIPQELLVDMLRAHVQTGPSFLRLMNTDQGMVLQMGHRIDLPCTLGRLVSAINELGGDVQNTRSLWSQVKN